MRPRSIVLFDRLFLASLAVGLINMGLTFSKNLELTEIGAIGPVAFVGIMLFGLAIPLLLWFFITRRASTVAKWILVVLTGLGLVSMVFTIPELMATGAIPFVITLSITALQVAAIVFLFRQDAVDWLKSRGTSVSNSSVFE